MGVSFLAKKRRGDPLRLNKLTVFWDNNGISIDGKVSLADSTDQPARFAAAHWNTIEIDGLDPEAVASALEQTQKSDRPTFIAARWTPTLRGSPRADEKEK